MAHKCGLVVGDACTGGTVGDMAGSHAAQGGGAAVELLRTRFLLRGEDAVREDGTNIDGLAGSAHR